MASSGDGGSSILRTRSAARSSQASSAAVRGCIAASAAASVLPRLASPRVAGAAVPRVGRNPGTTC